MRRDRVHTGVEEDVGRCTWGAGSRGCAPVQFAPVLPVAERVAVVFVAKLEVGKGAAGLIQRVDDDPSVAVQAL